MAEKNEKTTTPTTAAQPAPAAAQADAAWRAEESSGRLLVLKKSKKKKKKRKYTRGLKGPGKLQLGLARASWRLGDAVAEGLDRFRKRNDDSSRKRRDGAFRDVFKNASRGAGRFLQKSGKAPYDAVRYIPSRLLWRQARPVVQMLAWPFPR